METEQTSKQAAATGVPRWVWWAAALFLIAAATAALPTQRIRSLGALLGGVIGGYGPPPTGPKVTSLVVSPSSVVAGTPVTGTLTLASQAGPGGQQVAISSTNYNIASPPQTVTVAQNQTTATFSINTGFDSAATGVGIGAATTGGSTSAMLTVTPLQSSLNNLVGFTLSPTAVTTAYPSAGQGTYTGTMPTVSIVVRLDGPALDGPDHGVDVALAVNPNDPIGLAGVITVPMGQTSVTVPYTPPSVALVTSVTVSATYNGTTLTQPLLLTPGYLRVAAVSAGDVQLVWTYPLDNTSPNICDFFYILREDAASPGQYVVSPALPGSQSTYDDLFSFQGSHTYHYYLVERRTGCTHPPASPTDPSFIWVGEDQVTLFSTFATADQAVDSRIDPRYSTNHLLNFQFGGRAYNGGLFAGYAQDPAKVGRSFALFDLSGFPTAGALRFAGVSAYYLGAPAASSFSIGCQPIANTTWDAPSMTWTTSPSFDPTAATRVLNLSYDPATFSPRWVSWSMPDEILAAVTQGGPFSVAWAAPNETQPGWAYLAKTEYGDRQHGPAVGAARCVPTLLGLSPASTSVTATPVPWQPGVYSGGTSVGIVMSGLGPTDSVPVTVTVSGQQPYTAMVTQTNNAVSAGYTGTFSPGPGWEDVDVSATYGGRTVSTGFRVYQ